MKYLCLVYLSPEEWNSAPDEACMACGDELRASGHFITGTPLHPAHTATTVRVRNGQVSVTDGPFAETKEAARGLLSHRRARSQRGHPARLENSAGAVRQHRSAPHARAAW